MGKSSKKSQTVIEYVVNVLDGEALHLGLFHVLAIYYFAVRQCTATSQPTPNVPSLHNPINPNPKQSSPSQASSAYPDHLVPVVDRPNWRRLTPNV